MASDLRLWYHFHIPRKVENSLLAKHSGVRALVECRRTGGDGHRLTLLRAPDPIRQVYMRQESAKFASVFPWLPVVESRFPRCPADTEENNKTVWQNCQHYKFRHRLMAPDR